MRKELEGVGKGGMTEVHVNAMSARGGREGNPVCYFSSRVLIPSPVPPSLSFHYSFKCLPHRLQISGFN